MHDFVIKAIDDLLNILDSPIEYPRNKHGIVLEHKLFAVVQAREQIHTSACGLMDLIKIHESHDQQYKDKIIGGMKTTWHELTLITTRDIGTDDLLLSEMEEDEFGRMKLLSADEKRKRARESVTDDYMTTVSKAKELSARVAFQILDRIELLENPDAVNEEIINRKQTSNIIERFVENR